MVQGQPIGFSSPSTLFCPAVQLRRPIDGVDWSQEGRFSNPTPHLTLKEHSQPLANWLEELAKGILSLESDNRNLVEDLAKELRGFRGQLDEEPSSGTPGEGREIDGGSKGPLFNMLSQSAAAVEPGDSSCRLVLGDKQEKNKKPVILVDPDMPKQLQKEASAIHLYGAQTLATISKDAEQLRTHHKNEIDVVTPDELFLPNLTLLPGGKALVKSWLPEKLVAAPLTVDGQDHTPLLPFKDRLQNLFSSKELEKMVSLYVDHQQGYLVVELKVTLSGTSYPLRHSYPLKNARVLKEIPVMALWPSIPPDHWNQYWIFSQISSDGLSIDRMEDWDPPEETKSGLELVRYFRSSSFPDLLKVNVGTDPCGLIPLKTPGPISEASKNWHVGLDFGTSFTNWAIYDDNQAPHQLKLMSDLWQITAANDELLSFLPGKFFLPIKLHPESDKLSLPPTSTSLSLLGFPAEKRASKKVPELFHEARMYIPTSVKEESISDLCTGFKWEKPELQKPFLEQLALMISAHAVLQGVQSITWTLSYPTAFSQNAKRSYKKLWEDLTNKNNLEKITGLTHALSKINDETNGGMGGLESEAVAFARFLDEEGGNNRNEGRRFDFTHTACMDMGGGTTDLSLWQDSRLIHQVSIPFAGRDLCTKILSKRPRFTENLLDARGLEESHKSNRLSQIDNWIRFQQDAAFENLCRQRDQRDSTTEQFISLMALATGGLYHYLGLILQQLYASKSIQKKNCMQVYIGGNGGRLLNWLDPSCSFEEDSPINRWLSHIQAASANNLDDNSYYETRLSGLFKKEVAIGLTVKEQKHLVVDPGISDDPFSGEAIRINNNDFAAGDQIKLDKNSDEKVKTMEILNLEELQRYVNNVRDATKKLGGFRELQLDMGVQQRALDRLEGGEVLKRAQYLCQVRLGLEKQKNMGDFAVEPGFFLGLRALMELLTEDWANDKLSGQ